MASVSADKLGLSTTKKVWMFFQRTLKELLVLLAKFVVALGLLFYLYQNDSIHFEQLLVLQDQPLQLALMLGAFLLLLFALAGGPSLDDLKDRRVSDLILQRP